MRIPSRVSLIRVPLLLTALAAVQFTPPDRCFAQAETVAPGDRIRVKPLIRPKDRVTGSFIAVADDSLSFEVREQVRRLALTDIKTLEVSTGEKSHLAGTLAGGVIGAFGGAAIGATIEKATTDYCYDYCGLGGGFLGFIVGGIGGLFAGYNWLAHEKWSDIPIEGLRVSVFPGVIQFQMGL
jgi:hypothetical protein